LKAFELKSSTGNQITQVAQREKLTMTGHLISGPDGTEEPSRDAMRVGNRQKNHSTRRAKAPYLCKEGTGVVNMLQDVMSDNQIESICREPRAAQVFCHYHIESPGTGDLCSKRVNFKPNNTVTSFPQSNQ
jgi:hypothetical protein